MNLIMFIISGTAAGAVTGVLGAGGGMILVPFLSILCKADPKSLFPLSVSIMLPICLSSLFSVGTPIPFKDYWPYLIGSVIGGMFSLLISKRISVLWLHRIFGLLILWGGIRTLWPQQ